MNEKKDAAETVKLVEAEGREVVSVAGDVGVEKQCKRLVDAAVKKFGHIDVLVNNAAEQHEVHSPEELTEKQIDRTFRTNIYSFFFMVKHALPHMKKGSSIINTASITACRGGVIL